MESKKIAQWILRWSSLFASVAVLASTGAGDSPKTVPTQSTSDEGSSACSSDVPTNSKYLMIVSTLDGKVSALDMENGGSLAWSIDAGAAPLLSSSIGNMEILRDGVKTRLIPSLDGALYQFDGDSIEALPFTADTLLSSSFRFTDDSTIVGGKESITYGLEPHTGRLRYVCSMAGCKSFINKSAATSAVAEDSDTLVITRHTKTVRAVEMKMGAEKWNFSVGQHALTYMKNSDEIKSITEDPKTVFVDRSMEDGYIQDCPDEDDKKDNEDWFDFSWMTEHKYDYDLKVIVPSGLVLALDKNDPTNIIWQYKFSTSIASAWVLHQEELMELSLFEEGHVPAIAVGNGCNEGEGSDCDISTTSTGTEVEVNQPPLLYIGMHSNQMYVQPSIQMVEDVIEAAESAVKAGSIQNAVMPKIRWRPYLASANSRTPAVLEHKNPLLISQEQKKHEQYYNSHKGQEVKVWHEHYPFDGGYYVFPDTTPLPVSDHEANNNESTFDQIYGAAMRISLWNWWMEVTAISLLTSLVVHLVIVHLGKSKSKIPPSEVLPTEVSEKQETKETKTESLGAEIIPNNQTIPVTDFSSRFYGEFDQKATLGKGGFGVVFEVANKMDEVSYAVKRITLNNSEKARERVMREVKALAKLDHSGIVRYYQAWFESPPPGWQEEKDRSNQDLHSGTPTPLSTYTGLETHPAPHIIARHPGLATVEEAGSATKKVGNRTPKASVSDDFNPLKPFGSIEDWTMSNSDNKTSEDKKKGSSEGFLPRFVSDITCDSTEESDSNSFGINKTPVKFQIEDSLSIEFRNSDTETSQNHSFSKDISIPFKDYAKQKTIAQVEEDSFSIVFEDSGCADESADNYLFGGDDQDQKITEHEEECSTPRVLPGTSPSLPRTIIQGSPRMIQGSPRSTHHTGSPSSQSSTPTGRSWSRQSSPGGTPSNSPPRPSHLDIGSNEKPKEHKVTMPAQTPTPKLYLYIQMQLCRRDSLKDWLNANTLNRDRRTILDTFDQIVSAVDYIHGCGLMHRDLKPSNIFFSMDGVVKVGDFGLVTASEEQAVCDIDVPEVTPEGHHRKHTDQVGTKLYMSPEQSEGRSYSNKVDIYAMGLIFFELFYPFATHMERVKTLLDVRRQVFPSRFSRELQEECMFVSHLLHPLPEERPSTKDIQLNPLLKDFEYARQLVNRVRPRTRTTSTSSSNSGSGGSGGTTP